MDVEEQLKKAWDAVLKSGVPESLQAVALQEAMASLRVVGAEGGETKQRKRQTKNGKGSGKESTTEKSEATTTVPDEDTFFSTLADESGVEESDLRDVLQLTPQGAVHVTQPTRKLGDSTAQQARTTIALVAAARGRGLGENPVLADAVRKECQRKNCYQENNFASGHLAALEGFNAGSKRTEIVLTTKWIKEFSSAVDLALGRGNEDDNKNEG